MLKDDIINTISGPFKLPVSDPRLMEDPTSALFDLSGQVSEKSYHIRRNVLYTLPFMFICLLLMTIISVQQVVSANPGGIIIFFLILLSGLIVTRLLIFNYLFFDYFSGRFQSIRLVSEGNPNLYVPSGNTPVERFLNYLRGNYLPFNSLLGTHPESIQFSAIIRGQTGGAYQFDAYIGIPGGSPILKNTNLPNAMIKRGYALFIIVFEATPTLRDINALEYTVQDITAQTCLPPRVIILQEGVQEETAPLSPDVFRHITEEGAVAMCRKGNYPYNVQLVSGFDGVYDFVPVISSEGLP